MRSQAWFALWVLVLLAIGAFGLWRDRSAAFAEQRRRLAWEAEIAAQSARELVATELAAWAWADTRLDREGHPGGGAWMEPVPLPAPESPGSRAFDAGRFDEVIQRHAGVLSPRGIPLGPMAAFRKLLAAPDDGAALEAARLAMDLAFAHPSVMSPELLEKVESELARRGVRDSQLAGWRDRWQRLERAALALAELLQAGLPPAATAARELAGETWWVQVSPTAQGRSISLCPLAPCAASFREACKRLPISNGTVLALATDAGALTTLPAAAFAWPNESAPVRAQALRVTAYGDPSAVDSASLARAAMLGGLALVSCSFLCALWWRMKRIVRMQLDLARQKDDFLSTVSHELRTPVASMELLAGNLASGAVRSPEAVATYHQNLAAEARKLAATTEHLLDFALMERGQKAYRISTLDPAELAARALGTLKPLAEAKRIHLQVAAAPFAVEPMGDRDALLRVLVNLGDNAVKFSPPSTCVSIQLEPASSGHWTMTVTDQGPGIPRDDQPRVFDRFFRGGDVLRRGTRGTGIGLAVARHLVEGHGGVISLASSSANGTVFTCTLPLHPDLPDEDSDRRR